MRSQALMAPRTFFCASFVLLCALNLLHVAKFEKIIRGGSSSFETATGSTGKYTVLYDYENNLIVYKDIIGLKCVLEVVQGKESFIDKWITQQNNGVASKELNIVDQLSKRELWYFAKYRIIDFCKGLPTFSLEKQASLDIPTALTKEVDDRAVGRRKRQTSHYFKGRVRGQTQSQYLNFGKSDGDGKAEAESTVEGSKAVVTGRNGIGQAQSQSIPFGCDECYEQEQRVELGKPGGKYPEPIVQRPVGPPVTGPVGRPGQVEGTPGQFPGQTWVPGQGPSGVGGIPGQPGGIPGQFGTIPGQAWAPGQIPVEGPQQTLQPGQIWSPGQVPSQERGRPPGQVGTPLGQSWPTGLSGGPGETQGGGAPGHTWIPGQAPGQVVPSGQLWPPGKVPGQVGGSGQAEGPGQTHVGSTPGQTWVPGQTPGQVGGPSGQLWPPGQVGRQGHAQIGGSPGQTWQPGQAPGQVGGPSGQLWPPGQVTGPGQTQIRGSSGQTWIPGQVPQQVGPPGQVWQSGQVPSQVGGPGQTQIGRAPGQTWIPGQTPGNVGVPAPVWLPGRTPDHSGQVGGPSGQSPGQLTHIPGQAWIPGHTPSIPGQINGTPGQAWTPEGQISTPGQPVGPRPGEIRAPVQSGAPGWVPGQVPGSIAPPGQASIPGQPTWQGSGTQVTAGQGESGTFGGNLEGNYQSNLGHAGKFSGQFSGQYESYDKTNGRIQVSGGQFSGGQATGGWPASRVAPGGIPTQPGISGGASGWPGAPSWPGAVPSGHGWPSGGPGWLPGSQIPEQRLPNPIGTQSTGPGVSGWAARQPTGASIPATAVRPSGDPEGLHVGYPGVPGTPGRYIGISGGTSQTPETVTDNFPVGPGTIPSTTGGIQGSHPGAFPGGYPGGAGSIPGDISGHFPEGYSGVSGGYPGIPGGYPGVPGGYQGVPGGYQGAPGGYQGVPGGYQGVPGGYPGVPGGYPGAPGEYEGVPGGYPGVPGGYPAVPGGHPGIPGGTSGATGINTGYTGPEGSPGGALGRYPGGVPSGPTVGAWPTGPWQAGPGTPSGPPITGAGIPGGPQTGWSGTPQAPQTPGAQGTWPGGQTPGIPGISGVPSGVPQQYTAPGVGGGVEGVQYGIGQAGDDSDSQVQTSVLQTENGTQAQAQAQGIYAGGTAQSQVSGTYSGSGSFSASAGSDDGKRGAMTQVAGGKDGAQSSAQGRGGLGTSQSQVVLSSETGNTLSSAQSSGQAHGTQSQVEASEKGGLADAQANGAGKTSSQAQIGFSPYQEDDDDNQTTTFRGGGTAGAQSGLLSGMTQSQVQGKFRYGIRYTGGAQASSGIPFGKNSSEGPFKPLDLHFDTPVSSRNKGLTQAQTGKVSLTAKRSGETTTTSHPITTVEAVTAPQKSTDTKQHSAEYDEDDEYEDYEEETSKPATRNIISQVDTHQKQHIVLDPLKDMDVTVTQSRGSYPPDGTVIGPGETIPGSPGYRIPLGFRGTVKSIANGKNTYAIGRHSQAQSVTISPGTGKIIYTRPIYAVTSNTQSRNGQYGYGSGYTFQPAYQPVKYQFKNGKTLPDFVSVTKSETGSKNLVTGKKTPSVSYTQSSTCGIFINHCVYNAGKKLCFPKAKTNPDGTIMGC